MKSTSENRDRLATLAVTISGGLIFAVLWQLNYEGRYELYLVENVLALFFAPMLVIFFLLREDPSAFGFSIGESRRVRWLTVGLFAALLAVLIPASRLKGFQDYYPIFRQFESFRGADRFPTEDTQALLYGWASYGLYMFCWEFFFRGYLLFGLARTVKWLAVIVQAVVFGALHWYKVPLELAASFGAGIVLGILALRAKSFLPCFALHWLVSVSFDVLILVSRHQ